MRFWSLCLIILAGCGYFKPKNLASTEQPIATVLDQTLYPSDLDGLLSAGVSKSDSAQLVEKYINDWVKKQLMIASATQSSAINEAEIERRVLDYRYALIVHSFEKKHIDKHVNFEIDEKEVDAYYREKADNFLLKQNIFKGLFVQVPKSSPNLNGLRKDLKQYPANRESVIRYCSQFATNSFLEDSTWLNFDEVIFGTPLESTTDKTKFLKSTTYSETSDQNSLYFLVILDYKLIDEVSPLEFIRNDIRNIIINKRKITLKKELEENIYEEAKKNGLFKIY